MRKTTITLALFLSFVLCLFCFASCGKKSADATTGNQATAPATTASGDATKTGETTGTATQPEATQPEATEPEVTAAPHEHTPDTEWTVIAEPTCSAPGRKVLFCQECGVAIEEDVIPINPDAHAVLSWTVTKEPTLLEQTGSRHGECSLCHQDVVEELAFELEIQHWTDSSDGQFWYKHNIREEVLNGDHFYPTDEAPNGKDLLIEYSVLWNETIKNLIPGTQFDNSPFVDARIGNANGGGDCGYLIWWSFADNMGESFCKFAGGFESGTLGDIEDGDTVTPAGMCAGGGTYADYPNIAGSDPEHPEYGWHRIAIRYHEELTNEAEVKAGEKAKYFLSVTTYIDGVRVSTLTGSDMTRGEGKDSKLFTAVSDGEGGITYADNDRYLYGFRLNWVQAQTGKDVYFSIADYSVTVGDEFVQNVVPVDDPAEKTIEVAEGVTLPAKIWYTVPCDEHVWDGNDTVVKAATLLADGTRAKVCANCGATISTETVKYEPAVVSFTDASSDAYNPVKANLRALEGDKRFYPTDADAEGNDLLIEYSVLWNESMLNFLGSAKPYFHTCVGKENGTEQINNVAYWSPVADNANADCKFAGGFEYGTMRTSEEGNPYPQMTKPVGDSIDEFPNIGGNNGGDGTDQGEPQWGWHRVQIRLHVDVTNAEALKADTTAGATAATYKCTTTIYIDGVLVSILSSDTMTDRNNAYDNKLFSAASDGQGGIVYTDVREEEWIHAMRINSTKAKDGTTIYVVYGDVFVSCGKTFIQNVEKVATPAAAQFEVADGVTVPASMFYQAKAD